ncbi:hypothetical protein BJV82DRAFT_582114 [Fennellomyces sp. T-0311]|nr:hypothetical protein BJV82DRAFT_582113 [Fennellomyces sp. T-0311]KAI8139473.1 hypothetical protein BJV82DRAFT_582114 [Fennellomyces sp. T-0311]
MTQDFCRTYADIWKKDGHSEAHSRKIVFCEISTKEQVQMTTMSTRLKKEQNTEHGVIFPCLCCGEPYSSLQSLTQHCRTEHSTGSTALYKHAKSGERGLADHQAIVEAEDFAMCVTALDIFMTGPLANDPCAFKREENWVESKVAKAVIRSYQEPQSNVSWDMLELGWGISDRAGN